MTKQTTDKMMTLMAALVAAHGEGAIVSRKQILQVRSMSPEKFVHHVAITKNKDYRVGRNQFVVTLNPNPVAVRDKTWENMEKLAAKKEKTLPKEVRQDASKLLKSLGPVTKAPKKTKESAPAITSETNAMEGFEIEEENINALMRTMN